MNKGSIYNWKDDKERKLIYLGYNWSGNGMWHQFELVTNPGKIWCEVLDSDLHMLEEAEEMEAYTVTYEINIDATSPIHAALLVEKVLNSQHYRPFLTVTDNEGTRTDIDLESNPALESAFFRKMHTESVLRKVEKQVVEIGR
jgi:hypothetical protein